MKEIEEMQKIICDKCICIMGVEGKCSVCVNASEALYDAGYRKVKPVIAKINDNVEVHCDTMEDYDAFLKETLKPEVKTVGDRIRRMSDEEWAELCISVDDDNPKVYVTPFFDGMFDTVEETYNANLEWLRQEYKGK